VAGYFTKYFTKYFQKVRPSPFDPLDAGPDDKRKRKEPPEDETDAWQWNWEPSKPTTATFSATVVRDSFDDEDDILAILLLE
jgi:hypothetical protein